MKEASHKRPNVLLFYFMNCPEIGKCVKTGRSLVITWLWRGKHIEGVTANGYGVSFRGDGNALGSGTGDYCTILGKPQPAVHF